MRRFSLGFVFGLMSIAGFAEGSTLSALAASMASKTWVEVPTLGLVAASTGYAGGCSSHLIEYADNGVWDPVHQKFLFLGAAHYCWPWKFISYSEATNQWSDGPLPSAGMDTGGTTIGHGYDHNAVDPTTGDVYHKPYYSRIVYRYSNGSWSTFSTIPSNVVPSMGITGGLAYFPELNGLIYIQGADGGVYYYNQSTSLWSKITDGLAMGPYSNLIEYDRVNHRVYFGGGGNSTDFYSLDTNKVVTKKANAPIPYANSNGGASMAIDPVSGTVFLFAYSDSSNHEYNPETNTWSDFTGATPPFSFNFNNINAPLSTHGVTMFVTKATVYLYKHSPVTGAESVRPGTVAEAFTVSPNPVTRGRAIVGATDRSPLQRAAVYDGRGRRVATVTGGTINTAGWAAGVYVIRAVAGNRIFFKTISGPELRRKRMIQIQRILLCLSLPCAVFAAGISATSPNQWRASMISNLQTVAAADPSTMPANTWLDIPNTHLQNSPVAAPNYLSASDYATINGGSGFGSVMTAWSGGAYDTKREELIIWGGGHGDYYGNELYAFDVPALTWKRLSDATLNPAKTNCIVNWDGTPTSRHTYNQIGYIAHADCFWNMGGGTCGDPFSSDITWTFDLTAKTWTNRNPAPSGPGCYAANCSYDPESKKMWFGSARSSFDGLWDYDLDLNKWTKHNQDNFYDVTSALDTKRGVLVVVGKGQVVAGGEVYAYDIRNKNYTKQSWNTTGGASFISGSGVGLDYDPVADKIVGWNGGAVYALDPVSKVWTSYNPSGAPARTSNGIYGRWRYSPGVNAFVVVTAVSDDVRFYKMSAGPGTGVEKKAKAETKEEISVSPNPVISRAICTIARGSVQHASVYNAQGRLVATITGGVIHTDGWAAGIYVVQAKAGNQVLSKRFFVQK